MGIIIDLTIIAIVLISTFIGYKRGLVSVIFNLCAFIVALVVTMVLFRPITNLVINNTDFDDRIEEIIIDKGVATEKQETEEQGNDINQYIDKYVKKSVNETKNNVIESSAKVIAEKVIAVAVWIILFILIRIVLIFAKFIINGIANLPIIKQCNELGGIIYGFIVGLFIVYAILAILFFVVSVNNTGVVANAIDSSYIAKIIYGNNIILNFIF